MDKQQTFINMDLQREKNKVGFLGAQNFHNPW